jgi:flagellar FliL protein
MAKEEEAKDDADAKGGGMKKLIIIIVPVVLLLAVAGWFFLLKPDKSGAPEPLPHPTPGAVVKLESITINLAGAHFLKLGLALQPTATAQEVDGSKALDLAIDQFSQMTVDELSTAKGRREAKEELTARVKLTYLPHDAVLSEVTSLEGEKAKGEGEAEKTDEDASDEPAEIHVEDLTADEAIKRADSLTVQSEVYEIFFTEFVMQ